MSITASVLYLVDFI